MIAFLLGSVPFVLGGLTSVWIWRKANEAEQRGEPSLLRSVAGFMFGANVYATIALLLWQRVQWPVLFAVPLAAVAAPVSLIVLLVAVFRQRDLDSAVLALASSAVTFTVFVSNPPLD